MEAYKYRLIKEFCDLDVAIDRIEMFLETKKQKNIDVYKEYPHHVEQKNAMLDYSKALAARLVSEGILDRFFGEVRKSLAIDCGDDSVDSSNEQEVINKAFCATIKKSLKECFDIDAEIDIKVLGDD